MSEDVPSALSQAGWPSPTRSPVNALAEHFSQWELLLADGLTAMRARGDLRPDVDIDTLAVSILASVQGGLLLSQTRRDSRAVQIAVDTSIAYLRTLRP